MTIVETTAVIGAVTGVLGLLWSGLNWWHQRVTTRPRIVVRPRVWNLYDSNTGTTIAENAGVMEVSNIGTMPVAGSMIGFRLRRRKGVMFVPKPESLGGVEWRKELQPQRIAMLRFNLDDIPKGRELGRAFFKTIVGDTYKASGRDMRRFRKELARLRQ